MTAENTVEAQKKVLRARMLEKRARLNESTLLEASQNLPNTFKQHVMPKINPASKTTISLESHTIAGYIPLANELNPLPLLSFLMEQGACVTMPVVVAKNQPLIFRRYTSDCEMEQGRFGTLHPKNGNPIRPNIILVPLLGFDKNGFRIGYGGGFYDRTLALYPDATSIGLAFDEQYCPTKLPRDQFDIPLKSVLTPSSHYNF